jgi:hypothetical protein
MYSLDDVICLLLYQLLVRIRYLANSHLVLKYSRTEVNVVGGFLREGKSPPFFIGLMTDTNDRHGCLTCRRALATMPLR